MQLNLIEEFLLIALDDEKGQFVIDSTHLYFGFAGAILLEMALREKIDVSGDKLKLIHDEYEVEMVINKVIDQIKSSKPLKLKKWIEVLSKQAKELKEDTLLGLQNKGILRKEEHKILWIIPNNKYPTNDITPENKVRQHLSDVMLRGAKSETRDIMLLSLIDVSDLTKEAFRNKEEYKVVKKKIKEVTQDIKISQSVNKSIREIQAAIMVAMMSAIVVTTVTTSSN
ncbi:GPP34 family phosphoprotein [uncultured Roseivirga sp.]|uniref:GOLPH3/VPS74 family protein n=1 Tax=uncultured Roseivirga sp. TaxID=543088 RepID=UPI0030DD5CF8|tara:strand:+ start:50493 stop:51173 length:681 start_codon:yes stop_codon:yes gene_type:complete